jgi:plasmid stabilization system protein ParE
MRLRFTPRATRDLGEIAEYLRSRDPSAALAVRDAMRRG